MNKKKIELIKELYNKNYYPGLIQLLEMKANWEFIIMNELSEYSKPIKIFFLNNYETRGTLYLEVQKSLFLEFEMNKRILINNINLYFAKELIEKIIILPII